MIRPFRAGENQFFQRHRIPLNQIDFTKERCSPCIQGTASFFTNYTSCSEPNGTGKSLCFYAIAYQRAGYVNNASAMRHVPDQQPGWQP